MKQKTRAPEPTSGNDATTIKRLFTFGFTSVYSKAVTDLPPGKRGVLNALRLYYGYRHNGFLLFEALDICAAHHVNPPAWVIEALNENFQRYQSGHVSLERALGLTKRDREEYGQYREQHEVMGKVRKLINADPRRRIAPACIKVAATTRTNPDTLEKQYRKFWRGFFDYVGGK